jgi:hypothetical protein
MLSFSMLSVIMLNFSMLSVFMLSVIMLSVADSKKVYSQSPVSETFWEIIF